MENIKLINGDCLEEMKQIKDKSIDMILCDLPYGTTACKWDKIIPMEDYILLNNDKLSYKKYMEYAFTKGIHYQDAVSFFASNKKDGLWTRYNRIIKDNGAIVLFGSEPFSTELRHSNLKKYKYDWVWNKKLAGNGILAKKQPLKIHENVMVFNSTIYYPQMTKGRMRKKMGLKESELTGGNTYTPEYMNDEYYPQSIQEFSIANLRKGRLHPTQKPVELLEYLIKTYANVGETVLDSCMGSGSTGVACVNTNRNFIGIELDNQCFDIAKERIN